MIPFQGKSTAHPDRGSWDMAEVWDPRLSRLCESEAHCRFGNQYLYCKLQLLFLELVIKAEHLTLESGVLGSPQARKQGAQMIRQHKSSGSFEKDIISYHVYHCYYLYVSICYWLSVGKSGHIYQFYIRKYQSQKQVVGSGVHRPASWSLQRTFQGVCFSGFHVFL